MLYVYQKHLEDENLKEVEPVNLEKISNIRIDRIDYTNGGTAHVILFKLKSVQRTKSIEGVFIPVHEGYIKWKYTNKEDRDKEFKRLLLIFDALLHLKLYVPITGSFPKNPMEAKDNERT